MVMDEYDCIRHTEIYDKNHICNICFNTNLKKAIDKMYAFYKINNPVPPEKHAHLNFSEKNDYDTIKWWFSHNAYGKLEILDSRCVECIGERKSDFKRNMIKDEHVDFLAKFDWFLIQTWSCTEEKLIKYNNNHTINVSVDGDNEDIAEDFIIDFILQHPESSQDDHKQIIHAIKECTIYGGKVLWVLGHRYTACVGIKFGYMKNARINFFDCGNNKYNWYIVKVWGASSVQKTDRLMEKISIEKWIKFCVPNYRLPRLTYKTDENQVPTQFMKSVVADSSIKSSNHKNIFRWILCVIKVYLFECCLNKPLSKIKQNNN
jgi:hypothetical protein